MYEKKLAIYLPSLRGGGAERVMVILANSLVERGYYVDLVLAKAEGPYLTDVSREVRIVDLGQKRVAKSLPGLVRYLRTHQPQSMLAALNHANVIALLARRLAGVETRLVVSERNTPAPSAAAARSLNALLVHWGMRWFYPWADKIVAVSDGVADDLARFARLPRSLITTIYNPFDIGGMRIKAEEEPELPWVFPEALPVVLGVGRLTEQKDFTSLIQAFARVRQQRRVRLLILGEGELRIALAAQAKSLGLTPEDFAMPGFVSNPFSYLRRAVVFVLSSRWEGLPGVLIQAMACGAPVVATDCPSGPAEILEDGKWGRLVPVGDVSALADAIAATLDEEQHPEVAQRAADFSVDRAVDAYLRVMLPVKEEFEKR